MMTDTTKVVNLIKHHPQNLVTPQTLFLEKPIAPVPIDLRKRRHWWILAAVNLHRKTSNVIKAIN
jgi:hypothetical protein